MSYSATLRSALMRATAVAALAAPAAVIAPSTANAATGQINTSSLAPTGTTCRMFINSDITGTTADNGPNDNFATTIESAQFGVESRADFQVVVGSTQNRNSQIDFSNGQRALRSFFLRETTASGGGFTGTLDSVSFTRAEMIAAGGECARSAPNNAPTVEAGMAQSVSPGATVSLAGSASDVDADAISLQWQQVSGPTVTLSNPNSPNPTFVAPTVTAQTDVVLRLVATDAALERVTDTVAISITSNFAPTVNAGPDQNVAGGDTVTLAGTASDQDNDPLTTTWVQNGGPTVTLSDPNALNPTFTAPPRSANARTVSFELQADDGTIVSTDTVDIIVAANQAPNAVATGPTGPVAPNSQVTLDGTGSTDPEGDQLIYQWTQVAGAPVTLDTPNAATTTFTSPPGSQGSATALQFRLLVADPFDASDTATVDVNVAANANPTAEAGPTQSVAGGASVTLDGSGSFDPDGDALTYSWVQVSGNTTVALTGANTVSPSFTAPAATGQDEDYVFELTVDDGVGTAISNARAALAPPSPTDRVTITVLANRPPVADAGADQGPIDSGQTVTLDGTNSTDPDGDQLFYTWTQVSGTTVTLSDPNAAQPTFTAPVVAGNEDLEFSVTVRDTSVMGRTLPQQTDTVVIGIQAIGSITLIQQVSGRDAQFAFTSDLAALNASVTTSGGTGQIVASDVSVGSYTVTAPDLSAQGYVITGITCNDTDSVIDLSGRSVALELSANEDLVCTFSTANAREAASAAINNFLTGRNALILSHQPDLQRRLDRLSNPMGAKSGSVTAYGVPVPGSDHLPVQANVSRGSAQINTSLSMAMGGGSGDGRALDIWGEAYFSNATIGQQEGNFSILYLGADVRVSEGLLIGALVQKDEFGNDGDLEAGEAEGDGWMAGPYFTAQLGPQLFAEARAAWGKSDNTVSPLAGQFDDFDTSRSFYSGSLIGQFDLGDTTTLRPELTVRYLSENQKAYTDSNGVAIPSQTVAQGDVSFRPRLSHLVKMDSGWALRPFGEVEGIYTFGTGPDAALRGILPEGFAPTLGDFRGRVEGGFDVMSSGSFRATLSGFYDGIGADNFESTGVHVGVSFGF